MILAAKSLAPFILATGAILLFSATARADDFSGPYAGVEAGTVITDVDGVTIAGPFELEEKTTVVSAVAGYRLPLGTDIPVVLGVEGSVGTYTDHGDARYGVSGTAGVRVLGKGLLYGRIGYAWVDDYTSNFGKGMHGVIYGGGYEHKLTDSISLRGEYRCVDWKGEVGVPDAASYFEGQEITAALLYNF